MPFRYVLQIKLTVLDTCRRNGIGAGAEGNPKIIDVVDLATVHSRRKWLHRLTAYPWKPV